jgi:hypothetical protein
MWEKVEKSGYTYILAHKQIFFTHDPMGKCG